MKRVAPIRIVLGFAAAIFALWLSLSVTLAEIAAARRPELALRFAPWHAGAQAQLAYSRVLTSKHEQDIRFAQDLSQRAYKREVVNVTALTTLALIADYAGRERDALANMVAAERLSRRNVPTELWLIEHEAAAGRVNGALRHYDHALRTSASSGHLLYPILIAASSEPEVTMALQALLSADPPWRRTFMSRLADEGNHAPSKAKLAASALNLRRDRDLLAHFITRLVERRQYAAAWQLYEHAVGLERARNLVRDGRFYAPGDMPEFEWALLEEGDLSAVREISSRTNAMALYVSSSAGAGGRVARQSLKLSAGRYTFSAVLTGAEDLVDGELVFAINCSAEPAALVMRYKASLTAGREDRASVAFAIPQGNCEFQRLTIEMVPSSGGDTTSAWVHSVEIRPIANDR